MAGFVRRFGEVPTLEVIQEIEGLVIVDLAPPAPATGAGSGTVLCVGEFEDGFFATDAEAKGAVEVFGSEDLRRKFGSFGYTYGGVPASNPSARKHMLELWNGNGFLKLFKLKASRLMIARVDTSVGSVSFDPLASIDAGTGPFVFAVGQTLSFTTNIGTAASTALTGVVATKAGAGASFGTIVSGETFGIRIDGGPQVNVTFGAADTTAAAVIARINATLGFACAVLNTTQVDLRGIVVGTAGTVQLIEVTTGLLAKLGHTAGTTNGTGTFGNLAAVTAAELVAFINGIAGLTAIDVAAQIGPTGRVRFYNDASTAEATILIAAGAMATAAGVTKIDDTIAITEHPGGAVPAGTRVRTGGGAEWVTMQTLDVPAGVLGPFTVKVRPALDDGTAALTAAGTVTVIVDQPEFAAVVTNPAGLTAALTEPQLDNRYLEAMAKTLVENGTARVANYLLSARRSNAVVAGGRANVRAAREAGIFTRIFITGDPLGSTVADAQANVAAFRSDQVFYTSKGLKVRVPQIAERGVAGGLGFTDDGVITVRPDGPLTTICAIRPPEENPGQETHLIDDFFEVDTFGEDLGIEAYKAYKAAGIAVPRLDDDAGMVFQSGVTSSLESGRTTMARRKMADFLENTAVKIGKPYIKRLSSQARRDKLRGQWEGFLAGLKSEQNPELARIEDFKVDDSANAGNTADVLARGIYFLQTTVRTLSSMDDIVFQNEVGENAVITRES